MDCKMAYEEGVRQGQEPSGLKPKSDDTWQLCMPNFYRMETVLWFFNYSLTTQDRAEEAKTNCNCKFCIDAFLV